MNSNAQKLLQSLCYHADWLRMRLQCATPFWSSDIFSNLGHTDISHDFDLCSMCGLCIKETDCRGICDFICVFKDNFDEVSHFDPDICNSMNRSIVL